MVSFELDRSCPCGSKALLSLTVAPFCSARTLVLAHLRLVAIPSLLVILAMNERIARHVHILLRKHVHVARILQSRMSDVLRRECPAVLFVESEFRVDHCGGCISSLTTYQQVTLMRRSSLLEIVPWR